jgi:hypothetical protein
MHLVNKGKPPKGYTYLQCHTAKKGRCKNGLIRIEHAGLVFQEMLVKVDSMSLVHGKSADIRKSLETYEGRRADLMGRLKIADEAHTAWTSIASAKLLHNLEAELQQCSATRDELRQQLASTQVISKEDFFQKLDLVTYEGRAAANSLLKRLRVQIQFKRYNPNHFWCWVLDKSDDAITEIGDQMLFGIRYDQGTLTIQAFDDDIYERQIQQGELTATDFSRDVDWGIDGQWFC